MNGEFRIKNGEFFLLRIENIDCSIQEIISIFNSQFITYLDFAHKVDAWLKRFGTLFPLSRTNFTRVIGYK